MSEYSLKMGRIAPRVLLFGIFLVTAVAFEILSVYHQNDYDVKMDRCVVRWFNRSYFRDVKADFVPYNRTQRVLNYSLFNLQDLTNNITAHVQFYKFMSNEYRFFPLTVSVDICEHYAKNSFKVVDLLKNRSNATPCPWKKSFTYGYNILPDFSKCPPYIPRGSYMVELKGYHQADFVVHAEVYGSVADKPIKWN